MPKYWVLGDGNTSDTAHWSDTSGGAGGATVPTSTDDVVWDSLSHTTDYTVTVDATFTCRSQTWSAPASGNVTRAGTAASDIYGSVTLYGGMIDTYTGATTYRATTTGHVITTAGVTARGTWSFNGVGGGWVLGGALTHADTQIVLTNGSFDTAGYTVTAMIISSNNSNVRSLYLRGSSVNLSGSVTAWQFTTTTNLTFDAGTSTITLTRTDAAACIFAGDSLTYNHVIFVGNLVRSSGSWTCQNMGVLTAGYATGLRVTAGTTITIKGAFYTDGFAANLAKISSFTNGSPYTLVKTNGMVSVDYMSIRDCTTSGGDGWYAGVNSINVSGNTGWTFTAPPPWAGISSVVGTSQANIAAIMGQSKANGIASILGTAV